MSKCKLTIFEGFDRVGKDHLLAWLEKKHQNDDDVAVYIQHPPSSMPRYREHPEEFKEFLKGYLRNQVDDLKALAKTHKQIYMCRFFLSDYVYTHLFNRELVADTFKNEMLETFDIHNVCFLFINYDEYLKRLKSTNDSNIEYSDFEFGKISHLYEEAMHVYSDKMQSDLCLIHNDDWLSEVWFGESER